MPLLRASDPILVPRSPLFSGCTKRERRTLSRLGTGVLVDTGTTLAPEGQPGREFIVIESGEATCSVQGVPKSGFEAGDFFGEMALLDGGPHTATIKARTPMELVIFSAQEFRALLDSSAVIAQRLLVEMTRRLRAADAAT